MNEKEWLHEFAGQMIDIFEDYMSEEDEEDEVHISGEAYSTLEDKILETLANWLPAFEHEMRKVDECIKNAYSIAIKISEDYSEMSEEEIQEAEEECFSLYREAVKSSCALMQYGITGACNIPGIGSRVPFEERLLGLQRLIKNNQETRDLWEKVAKELTRANQKNVSKKYELTDETKIMDGHTLHRIRALRSFGNVKEGDLGGFVESEANLSHDGNAWVGDNACVYEQAWVKDDVVVSEKAWISGYAVVSGNAVISGDTWVYEHTEVSGNAIIRENACVYGKAVVSGNAEISGDAWVCGKAHIGGAAKVCKYMVINEGIINEGIMEGVIPDKKSEMTVEEDELDR